MNLPQYNDRKCDRAQVERLVVYMENHSLFCRGQIMALGAKGDEKFNSMWDEELTVILNNMGPAVKSSCSWKKTWDRLRLKAKMERAAFITNYNRTGNIIPDKEFKELDERISTIFGSSGDGLSLIPEAGFGPSLQINSKNGGKGTRSRPTHKQILELISFMENNINLALNQIDFDEGNRLWRMLSVRLNNVESNKRERDIDSWRRTWQDLCKAVRQRNTIFQNGGRLEPLSDTDMRVLSILQIGNVNRVANDQPVDNEANQVNDNAPINEQAVPRPGPANQELVMPVNGQLAQQVVPLPVPQHQRILPQALQRPEDQQDQRLLQPVMRQHDLPHQEDRILMNIGGFQYANSSIASTSHAPLPLERSQVSRNSTGAIRKVNPKVSHFVDLSMEEEDEKKPRAESNFLSKRKRFNFNEQRNNIMDSRVEEVLASNKEQSDKMQLMIGQIVSMFESLNVTLKNGFELLSNSMLRCNIQDAQQQASSPNLKKEAFSKTEEDKKEEEVNDFSEDDVFKMDHEGYEFDDSDNDDEM